jgi:hypothetical protein
LDRVPRWRRLLLPAQMSYATRWAHCWGSFFTRKLILPLTRHRDPLVHGQFKVGSLILIDVFTDKGAFNFSLTPKGYQAGIAQIRAWGYPTE